MKRKLIILAFGLLLAVGWTNDASAQLKRGAVEQDNYASQFDFMPEHDQALSLNLVDGNGVPATPRMNAPRRGHSDVYANEVSYTKEDYSRIKYTWYEGETTNAAAHPNTSLTDVVANNPYQMYWLLRSVYTDTDVPGILWNDMFMEPTQYYGIAHGWNIGDVTSPEIGIELNNQYGRIKWIELYDLNNTSTPFYTWTAGNSLPTGWLRTTTNMSNTTSGLSWNNSGGGVIIIPTDFYPTHTNGIRVRVQADKTSSSEESRLYINNSYWTLNYNSTKNCASNVVEGRKSITPPDYNAYTVFLIKLKDFTETMTTTKTRCDSTADIINLFTNYFESVELLTDGLRVGEGTETAGTVFAYRGVLNRFYFIGKGKTATHRSTSTAFEGAAVLGPFYEMFEEFSPTTTDAGAQTQDFYTDMHGGQYYPVVHDCATVLGYEHFFSMYGRDTIVYKSVAPMVLYIPDFRSISRETGWARNYEEGHKPQVGLYQIKLTAETEPVADYSNPDNRNYIVYLDWTSSLNTMVNNTVPQTYVIYTVTYDPVTNAPIYNYLATVEDVTTYDYIVPQEQTSQQIQYVVMGYPTNATNNPDPNNGGVEGGIFFTYSDPDDVQIPGWFDFMILYRERYESDFVIQEEKNYYRNYLYPTNLAPGTGMTMEQLKKEWPNQTASYTLWRDNTGVAKLEVRAIGDKVYYRIRYYEDTQVTTGPNRIGVATDKNSGNANMPYNYVEIPNDND